MHEYKKNLGSGNPLSSTQVCSGVLVGPGWPHLMIFQEKTSVQASVKNLPIFQCWQLIEHHEALCAEHKVLLRTACGLKTTNHGTTAICILCRTAHQDLEVLTLP